MNSILGMEGAPIAGGPDPIKDATTDTFMADVIDASREVPVLVDFWAPWCGPCKQLTPALEAVVKRAAGAVRLVKINIDESPEIAQQMRIQSIPMVYAFKDGQPVDGFQGAVPESQIQELVDRVSGGASKDSPIAQALDQAEQLLEAGDHQGAGGIFQQVLQHDPDNVQAFAGLLKSLIADGRAEDASAALAQAPETMAADKAIQAIATQLELAAQGAATAGAATELRAKIEANPKDHQARIDLAAALYAAGDAEGAVDQLLESIRLDRKWQDEAARKALLKYFEALGSTDPVTADARRRLSSILFA